MTTLIFMNLATSSEMDRKSVTDILGGRVSRVHEVEPVDQELKEAT
ncbi:hypothetical protein [Paraburkholderia sp. BL10I2N1]|nr:hypothetical protein [Paraburkholderia sp. BL10I2N1]